MDTTQINNTITAAGFLGAFPYDELPTKPNTDSYSLVINTDSSHEPGNHWLVLLCKNNHYYFFDSFGRQFDDETFPTAFSTAIKNYIQSKRIKFNGEILQQLTSNTCGYHCVYFIEKMVDNSFKDILADFGDNLKQNDKIVTDYVNKM